VAKLGHQHTTVGDIEIRVTGWQWLSDWCDLRWSGERDHFEGPTFTIPRRAQPAAVFSQGVEVGTGRIDIIDQGDPVGTHEASHLIDASPGDVSHNALCEPNYLGYAQHRASPGLKPGSIGVDVFVGIQQR
jgi:hypothetical protein